MKIIIKPFLLLFLLLFFINVYSQSKGFFSFEDSLGLVNKVHGLLNNNITNPAFTGIFGGHNMNVNANAYQPFFNHGRFHIPLCAYGTYDFTFGKDASHAAGMFYSNLRGGIYKSWSAGLNYAKNIDLFMTDTYYHKLRLGASLAYSKATNDKMLYTFGDMIDPKYGFVWNTAEMLFWESRNDTLKTEINLNTGLWYHNPHLFFGVGTNSFSERDTLLRAFNAKPATFFITTGGHIYINNDFSVHPSINIDIPVRHAYFSTYSPAVTGAYQNKVFLGFLYKNLNTPTLLIGGTFRNTLTVSAMYGFATYKGAGLYEPSYLAGNISIHFKNK